MHELIFTQVAIIPIWTPISIPIEDVLALLKKNFTLGVLFEKWVGPDDRNSKNHIIQVSQERNIFPNSLSQPKKQPLQILALFEKELDSKLYSATKTGFGPLGRNHNTPQIVYKVTAYKVDSAY